MEKIYFQCIRLNVNIFVLNIWRKLLVKSWKILRKKLFISYIFCGWSFWESCLQSVL